MTGKAFLIFSGYNQRAVIAFCREAKRLQIPFFIVAKSMDDTIFLSSYKENVLSVRQEKALLIKDVDACFLEVKTKSTYRDFVILPSSEFLNRFFLENRAYYQNQSFSIPLVEESLYSILSDKYSFGLLCQKYHLEIPPEIVVSDSVGFPFVAKPKEYFSKGSLQTPSPYLIYAESDWLEFLELENPEDFYFQKFVSGQSIYLLFFLSKQGRSVFYSQENLVQQSKGKSILLARSSTTHLETIASDYSEMLLKEGFEGLIMIELKYSNGSYCMIEANPRLWGPSQLFVDAGVPIFEEFIRHQGFILEEQCYTIKESVYFWHGGVLEEMKKGKTLAFHNYSSEMLDSQWQELLKYDIYLREDTKNIYYNELNYAER